MTEPTTRPTDDAPLNPALKSRRETTYDTSNSTPAPLETTAAKEGQGEGWPIIWLVVTILGILLALYFIL